jgi:hypothetical protein
LAVGPLPGCTGDGFEIDFREHVDGKWRSTADVRSLVMTSHVTLAGVLTTTAGTRMRRISRRPCRPRPSTGIYLSDRQKTVIRKIEADIQAEFSGEFRECHWDFKSPDSVCAVDGGV